MDAGGDLGLEDQQHPVGLHQDAGDAEHEADAERRLAQPAAPVFGSADERQGAGEGKEEEEGADEDDGEGGGYVYMLLRDNEDVV